MALKLRERIRAAAHILTGQYTPRQYGLYPGQEPGRRPSTDVYVGNPYKGYIPSVAKLWELYSSQGEFGNAAIKSVIRYRAGVIGGNGANIGGPESTRRWVTDFQRDNHLNSKLLRRIVILSQLEYKVLVRIFPDPSLPSGVRLMALPWYGLNYAVKEQGGRVARITVTNPRGGNLDYPLDSTVFINLDPASDPNEPANPIFDIIHNAINLDKAQADLRGNNARRGRMGIHYEATDLQNAHRMIDEVRRRETEQGGFSYGDVMAGPAKAYYPVPPEVQAILDEMDSNGRAISGVTGVPVHHLGYVHLMSNRATATEMVDVVSAHMFPDRDLIETGLQEIVEKSVRLVNRNNSGLATPIIPESDQITVTLTPTAQQQIKDLMDVFKPLAEGGFVSRRAVSERIPGIDPAVERMQMDEEAKAKKSALQSLLDDEDDDDED